MSARLLLPFLLAVAGSCASVAARHDVLAAWPALGDDPVPAAPREQDADDDGEDLVFAEVPS